MEGLPFGISLEDRMSGPANQVAKSLSRLHGAATHTKGVLDSLEHHLTKITDPARTLEHAFEGVTSGLSEFAEAFKGAEVKGMVEGATEALAGLAKTLDLVYPGLGQIASAVIKADGSFAAMTVGLLQSGAELALEQVGLKERLESTFDAFEEGFGPKALGLVDEMSAHLGKTREEVGELARHFASLGVTDVGQLRSQLLSVASAAALAPKTGEKAYLAFSKRLQSLIDIGGKLKLPERRISALADMGVRLEDVAKKLGIPMETLSKQLQTGGVNAQEFANALQDVLQEKGAGPLDRLVSELGPQLKKAKDNFSKLFDGVDVKPFLDQMKGLLFLLDASNPAAIAMKGVITAAFNGIFKVAGDVIPLITIFFQEIIIWSLKTYIFVKQHWEVIKDTFWGVVDVMGAVGTATLIAVSPLILLGGTLLAAGLLAAYVIDKFYELVDAFYDVGKSVTDGLVAGITNGAGSVVGSVVDVVGKSVDAAEKYLDIGSPSKVMMRVGGFMAEGMSEGLKGGEPGVSMASQDIARTAVTAPIEMPRSGREVASSDSKSSSGISINGLRITIEAPQGVTGATELTAISLATVLEQLQITQGA